MLWQKQTILTSFTEPRRGGGGLGNIRFDRDNVSCTGPLHSQRTTLLMPTMSSGFTRANWKSGKLLFSISIRSIWQGRRTSHEERALVACRTTDVQNARYSPTRLSDKICIMIANLLSFGSRLKDILRACWRIGSWVKTLSRPRPGSLLEIVRSRASGRQRKGATAGG